MQPLEYLSLSTTFQTENWNSRADVSGARNTSDPYRTWSWPDTEQKQQDRQKVTQEEER